MVKGGAFFKHKMVLVRKEKMGMVMEVMAKVGRIWSESSGTWVVVVLQKKNGGRARVRRHVVRCQRLDRIRSS